MIVSKLDSALDSTRALCWAPYTVRVLLVQSDRGL